MSKLIKRIALSVVTMAWAIWYLVDTASRAPKAVLLIRPVVYIMGVLFLINLVRDIRKWRLETKGDNEGFEYASSREIKIALISFAAVCIVHEFPGVHYFNCHLFGRCIHCLESQNHSGDMHGNGNDWLALRSVQDPAEDAAASRISWLLISEVVYGFEFIFQRFWQYIQLSLHLIYVSWSIIWHGPWVPSRFVRTGWTCLADSIYI